MKKVVVDASVAIKWFVPEVHSLAAARLLDSDILLCAPDLIGPEVGNTLWKKVRRTDITREQADKILAAFDNLPLEVHPTSVLLPAAFDLAVALDRSFYDSLYLALAVAEDCGLITADAKFHSALKTSSLGGRVHWVEDEI